jgi:hypothetical protein
MFDLQSQLDNYLTASRQKELAWSDRLSLWEIIIKLEWVKNKSLPLVFDIPWAKPYGVWSWRGIYAELAIYTEGQWSIQTGEMKKTNYWDYPKSKPLGKENPSVEEFIEILKECVWATFTGYKWWDFTMWRTTAVSVCKKCSDSGYSYSEDEYTNTFILDIHETDECVILITWKED